MATEADQRRQRQLGENVRAHRLRLGLTQETLAHRCDLHPVELGRAERGVRDLRLSTIAKLAGGLDVAPADLLDGL